jgi:pyrroline-5-carboxylate reductase
MALAGPLLLVGCGKMGGALLGGWRADGLPAADMVVVEPAAELAASIREAYGVTVVAEPGAIPKDFAPRALILAIKPQMMADALPAYRAFAHTGAVVISIAAGITLDRFARVFGDDVAVVRAMPNTPAAIRRGTSALIANHMVNNEQRALSEQLMAAVGAVHWIDSETQMHAITAMSGGGPAYVFLLIETLAEAGISNGLAPALARQLARETVIGSGALAEASPEPPDVLRRNVTSPGGTTEAALRELMAEDGIRPLFERAIAAAARRSQELA